MICRFNPLHSVSRNWAEFCPACLSTKTERIANKLVCHSCQNIVTFESDYQRCPYCKKKILTGITTLIKHLDNCNESKVTFNTKK